MDYKIGICDTDSHYSLSLMDYINMHANIPLKCAAFSSCRAIEEYMRRDSLDLVLLDEHMEYDVKLPWIKMTERRAAAGDKNVIYKYQNIDDIVELLLDFLTEQNHTAIPELRIYGVYSPLGRCGKTRLALGICCCHPDSLYIGLEDYPQLGQNTGREIMAQSERFLYLLLSQNESILALLQAHPCEEQGFRIIYGSLLFSDGRQIERKHMSWLCDLLRKHSDFRRVVFDIGTGALSEINLLNCFDCVFVPVLEDAVSRDKLRLFQKLAAEENSALEPHKLTDIRVPDGTYDSPGMQACVEGRRI